MAHSLLPTPGVVLECYIDLRTHCTVNTFVQSLLLSTTSDEMIQCMLSFAYKRKLSDQGGIHQTHPSQLVNLIKHRISSDTTSVLCTGYYFRLCILTVFDSNSCRV